MDVTWFHNDPLFDVGGFAEALDYALPMLDEDWMDQIREMEREKPELVDNTPRRSMISPLWLALGVEKREPHHTLDWLFSTLKVRMDELANVKHELEQVKGVVAQLRNNYRLAKSLLEQCG